MNKKQNRHPKIRIIPAQAKAKRPILAFLLYKALILSLTRIELAGHDHSGSGVRLNYNGLGAERKAYNCALIELRQITDAEEYVAGRSCSNPSIEQIQERLKPLAISYGQKSTNLLNNSLLIQMYCNTSIPYCLNTECQAPMLASLSPTLPPV